MYAHVPLKRGISKTVGHTVSIAFPDVAMSPPYRVHKTQVALRYLIALS